MANSIFNPSEFFDKTAHFASQGRGLFTLTHVPDSVKNYSSPSLSTRETTFSSGIATNYHVGLAETLLKGGIVAKTITSPGSRLATFEEFSYIGPTRKHPHTQIFGPLSVDFYLMGKDKEEAQALYKTFMLWHEVIAGARFSLDERDQSIRSDSTFFAIQYYDTYVTEAEFKVYSTWELSPTLGTESNNYNAPIIHNKYYEIYPVSIGQLSSSWDSADAPMILSVEFEFYYMQSRI